MAARFNRPSSTVLVAGMLVLGPQEAGYCMGGDFELGWGDTEYELIDFDSTNQSICPGPCESRRSSLGGRLSGTVEENALNH